MHDRAPTIRDHLLTILACLGSSLVVGMAYTVVAPPLVPYATLPLNGWSFALIAFASTVTLGIGIGYRRPGAIIASAIAVSFLSSAIYALMLALPAFTPNTPNVTGLINYAVTQASVTFFIVFFIALPGAIVGLLTSYFLNDR